jgi:hypothetical protein
MAAQNTVLCLFREPLPAGKVEIAILNIECLAEAHVWDSDRRIAEININPPKQSSLQKGWQFFKVAVNGALGKSEDPTGVAELGIPADFTGESSSPTDRQGSRENSQILAKQQSSWLGIDCVVNL